MTILRWIARTLSVLIVLFFVASLLGEQSPGTLTLLDWIKLGLWFVVIAGLLISWKREAAGGLIVIGAFLIMAILNPRILLMWAMWISPVAAVLFLLCGLYGRKKIEPAKTAA